MNHTPLDIPSLTQRKQILLVAEQPDVRDALRTHLELEGHQVIEAAEGIEALALVDHLQPDLILIDLDLPELDGISLCQQVRQMEELADTPLLLVTDAASEEILRQALAAGASDYITKPISWPLFHHRVQAVLRAREADRTTRAQERRWQQLLVEVPGLVYTTTPDAKRVFLSVSPGCLTLTGYLPERLLAPTFPGYSSLLHPGDREHTWAQVEAALAQRDSYTLTYRLLTAMGGEKLVWEKGHGVYGARGEVQVLEGVVLPFSVAEPIAEG